MPHSHPSGSSGSNFDEWAGENETPGSYDYDPDKVYVAAADKRGHSTSIKVNVPAGLPGTIASLVAQVPELRNAHDFYRDAIIHAIFKWRAKLPELEASPWGMHTVQWAAAEDQMERLTVERDVVAKWRKLLSEAQDSPMVKQAVLMQMRSLLPTLSSESLQAEVKRILEANPIFTDDLLSS